MSTYQSPKSKQKCFRQYLEKSGAIDSLTSALVNLYEESNKPHESTEYIKQHLGDNRNPPIEKQQQLLKENEMLDKENERLKQKVDEMTKTIETLKKNLNHLRAHSRKARDEKS